MPRRGKEVAGLGGSVADVVRQLEKQYGRAVIASADAAARLAIRRLPSRCFAFDFGLAGGIPIGRTTLLSGAKASGKTTMALRFVASWQRTVAEPGQVAVWIDAEAAFDPGWAQAAGVDLDRCVLVTPKVAEQSFDYVARLLATREAGMVVVDSLAAMAPAVELSASGMDQQRADAARLLNKLMRVLSGLHNAWQIEGAPKTVLLINQLRQKLAAFGSAVPLVEPGGLGQLFHSALVVRLRRTAYEFLDDAHATDGTGPSWATIAYRVEHSKVSPPNVEGEIRLCLRDHAHWRRTDTDDTALFVLHAQRSEVLRRDGNGWVLGVGERAVRARTREELLAPLGTLRRYGDGWDEYCAFQDAIIDSTYKSVG